MSCPFFRPTHRADDLSFPHPARLPLAAPWRGLCEAPGCEPTMPRNEDLESCNLGYAKTCPRLPIDRSCDAVRFGIAKESRLQVSVTFVLETSHLPTAHGVLEYDRAVNSWTTAHPDDRIQHLADCFLKTFLEKRYPAASL